ncbi:MAG: hypothetical protein GX601_09015 [Anaerolineales bacterium]|nr:hypothetical protein [Anaerolineales bacterium]
MNRATRFRLTIPARINILGNPADGNEGAHATISAAIDTYSGATIEPAEGVVLEEVTRTGTLLARQEYSGSPPYPYDGVVDLEKGAFNRLHAYSAEFRQRLADWGGVRVRVWTDVPRHSGLGGSSLPVLLTLTGLRALYQLDPLYHNNYVLAEMCQRVEAMDLGIVCGYADRYVPLFGGLAYVDYHGKVRQRPLGEEPFATYERLDGYVADPPLVIAFTGLAGDSGDVHGCMRPLYLQAYDAHQRGAPKPFLVDVMERAWITAWQGKMVLLRGDWAEVGRLMGENHRLVHRMMMHCGLPGGAGPANNALIDAALEAGALGAKLTGAGGRGSVFALTRPGEEDVVLEAMQRTIAREGMVGACAWHAHVDHEGLRLQPESIAEETVCSASC